MAVPREIITTPDRLTDEEWLILKTHPVVGAQMIAAAPELAPVVPIVGGHHERFDGRGYPDSLKGTEIPLPRSQRTLYDCRAFLKPGEATTLPNVGVSPAVILRSSKTEYYCTFTVPLIPG